jgi:hypothetical protein
MILKMRKNKHNNKIFKQLTLEIHLRKKDLHKKNIH